MVIGGGIAGCLTACLLADQGAEVTIVEQRPGLLEAASLWNDGKIHLGYTFLGTPSTATAALMIEGAAVFLPIIERVLEAPVPSDAFGRPVVYLVDPDSLVDADTLWRRAKAVAGMLQASAKVHPGLARFVGTQPVLTRLDPADASRSTGQDRVAAGWQTTEMHVSAREIARGLRAAVRVRGIDVHRGRVQGIESIDHRWRVTTDVDDRLSAPVIVNCTWESRALLDRQVRPSTTPVSIRYKHCLFGRWERTRATVLPSTRILGRFGDVAIYANGDAYLSWYPAALAAMSDDGVPPSPPRPDTARVVRETLLGLGMQAHADSALHWQVGGGYVVAHGYGDIDRIDSPLHDRSRPAVHTIAPGYVSVDTGKYTLGPMLAERAAATALRQLTGRGELPGLSRQFTTAP